MGTLQPMCVGVIPFFLMGPTSTNDVNTRKHVLHQQIYDESSTKVGVNIGYFLDVVIIIGSVCSLIP